MVQIPPGPLGVGCNSFGLASRQCLSTTPYFGLIAQEYNMPPTKLNHLRSVLEAIRCNTTPVAGHSDPLSIIDCWTTVYEELDDHEKRIRAKLDELMHRPTGLTDQLADLYRGRVEALRWVLGELDEI